jgi:hypothetical protein
MLIITNPVEQTKQHLPSMLIRNQVQDNSQMRLVILNRNPSKLMQSNAIVINKIIGTKDQDTLAFKQRVVAQIVFTFTLFQALEPRTTFTLIASIIGHKTCKANKHAYTKNKAPIKRKL